MARKETTYAGVLGDWQRLLPPLAANASDLPHLEAPRGKLQTLLSEALEISKSQAALTAEKQEASKRLKELIAEGRRLATVLRLAVKEHYGLRSEKVAEFGLQPFRGRKAKPDTPVTPGTPAPSPTPSTPIQ